MVLSNLPIIGILVVVVYIFSFNHPCVCRIELSNPSCLTAGGSVEFKYNRVIETFSYIFVSFNVL